MATAGWRISLLSSLLLLFSRSFLLLLFFFLLVASTSLKNALGGVAGRWRLFDFGFFFPFYFPSIFYFTTEPPETVAGASQRHPSRRITEPSSFFFLFFFEILDPFASETPKRKSILGPASLNGNSDIIDPIDNRRSFSLALFIPLSFSFFLFSFFLLGWRQGRGRGSSRLHQFDQTVVFFLLTTRPPR